MKKVNTLAFLTLAFLCFLVACQNDDFKIEPQAQSLNLPAQAFNYANINTPAHFTGVLDNTPFSNRVTDHGATLGRVLFYDTKLSLNNLIACASCHHQENGFADPNTFSEGFNKQLTSRNSMPIFNNKHNQAFFWDMEVEDLEEQVLMPIKDHIEMGIENLSDLEQKLNRVEYYPPLFEKAFGSSEITAPRIAQAMSQFIRSIVSYESKYDSGIDNDFSNFNTQEKLGFEVFKQAECDGCHTTQNFGGVEIANIGLESNYVDKGIGALHNSPEHNGMFKVPSLRNIELTAPYMHDGRFTTLEEVVQHYSERIVAHPNLHSRLTTVGNSWNDIRPSTSGSSIMHFEFTAEEAEALVAFLKTLTDTELTSNEKFANPFQ